MDRHAEQRVRKLVAFRADADDVQVALLGAAEIARICLAPSQPVALPFSKNLAGARLEKANLTGANLAAAKPEKASFRGANVQGCTGCPAPPAR